MNPGQTGGVKNLKQRRHTLLLQTMKIVILLQMCVTVGVLYLKHHSLDRRIRKKKDHVADYYQLCQGRKKAEVRFISQKSMAFKVSCTKYVFVKKGFFLTVTVLTWTLARH